MPSKAYQIYINGILSFETYSINNHNRHIRMLNKHQPYLTYEVKIINFI